MVGLFILVWILLAFLLFWNPAKALIKWISRVIQHFSSKENPTIYREKSELPSSSLLKFFDYVFLLRVPIISGLILFSFPFIAQWGLPKFLQNLFVMDGGIQMIVVMVFATLTAIPIISLIKTMVLPNSEINEFKDLIIWQKGMDIAEKCYFLTKLFPKDVFSSKRCCRKRL